MLNFEINSKEIDKIEKISTEEKNLRSQTINSLKNELSGIYRKQQDIKK